MKELTLILLFVSLFVFASQAQRISATGCHVTVYTDNGAYVKAFCDKSESDYTVKVVLTYTKEATKDGKTITYEDNYEFSIISGEEKQLFVATDKVIALNISSCEIKLTEEQKKAAIEKLRKLKGRG